MIERQILSRLDADTAEALGQLYTGLGRELIVQARYTAAGQAERERLRRRRREARQIAAAVESLVSRHQKRPGAKIAAPPATPRQAVALVQGRWPEWKPEEIAAVWMLFRRSAGAGKARRDLEILRLARRPGWTNVRLGEKFRLHPDTISRIITRGLGGAPRRYPRAAPLLQSERTL